MPARATRTTPRKTPKAAPTDANRAGGLGVALDFLRVVWAVDHALASASKRMEQSQGVTGPQRLVLRLVARQPGLGAGRLAELLEIHPSTLTGIVKRLVEHGLLERKGDPRDGRRARLSVTPRGKLVEEERGPSVESAVQRALAKHAPRDVAAAERVLGALTEELGRLARVKAASTRPPAPAR